MLIDNDREAQPLRRCVRYWPGVTLRCFGRNRGFARAVNEGCRRARGEWLLLLNPDVRVPEEFLDAVLAAAEQIVAGDPKAGIIGFQLRHDDETRQGSTGPEPSLGNVLAGLLRPRSRRRCQPISGMQRRAVEWVTGCCLLVRRECWERLGGFDEDYFLYYEDVDLCRRARSAGWSVWYDPTVRVTHFRPLHTRPVSAALRLMTRHALLDLRREALAALAISRSEWARLGRSIPEAGVGDGTRPMGIIRALPTIAFASPRPDPRAGHPRSASVASLGPNAGTLMRLSIVIPTYNRPDLLRACLASVCRFAPKQTEIVVVDDASPVHVASVVAEFSGVRHLRLAKRRGFCAAANAGIAATTAPIVELLNDDTEVAAGWADAALGNFDDPNVAAVAPLVLRPDGRIDSAGDHYDRGGFAQKIGHGRLVERFAPVRREVHGASASIAFYRRSMLEAVGGFPESFGAYFDDVDLSCRLRRAGGKIVFDPASRVVHHGGASHGPLDRRLVEQQSCNEERLYWRNADGCAHPAPTRRGARREGLCAAGMKVGSGPG